MTYSNKVKSKGSVFEYIVVLSILLASGTTSFNVMHAGITLVGFLCVAVIYALKNKFSIRKLPFFFWAYVTFIFVDYMIHGLEMKLVEHAFCLGCTTLILLSMDYKRFRRVYLNVIVILVLVSILLQIAYLADLIEPQLQFVGSDSSMGFYVYAFHTFGGAKWGLHNQLAGIFWEPGIYQMALNSALLLNTDLIFNFKKQKYSKIKFLLITIAVLLTQSTTGYLVYGTIILGVVLGQDKLKTPRNIALILLGMVASVVVLNSSVVQDKFSTDNASYLVRMNDNFALLNMIADSPLLGSGVYSETYQKSADFYGMTGAQSNGLLLATAQYGVFWALFFVIGVIKEYKKRTPQINVLFYLGAFIMMNIGEPLSFAPFMLMFVLPFKYYNNETSNSRYSYLQHGSFAATMS